MIDHLTLSIATVLVVAMAAGAVAPAVARRLCGLRRTLTDEVSIAADRRIARIRGDDHA